MTGSNCQPVLQYLKRNLSLSLPLQISDLELIHWWVDASFTVHKDFKSHIGGTMSVDRGSIIDICKKQKINMRSFTEANVVGVDNVLPWTI